MAHKVKVSGTNYAVKKGICKVGGTNYTVYGGKTKIGSTYYWIDLNNSKSVAVSVSGSMESYFAFTQGTYISCEFNLYINGVSRNSGNYTARSGQTIRITGSGERYSSSTPSPSTLMGDAPLIVYYNGSKVKQGTGSVDVTYILTDDTTIRFEDNYVYIDVGGVSLTKTGSPTGTWYYQHPCGSISGSWTATVKVNGTDMSSAGTIKIPKNATVDVTNVCTLQTDVGQRASISYNGSTVSTATSYNGTASYTFTATGTSITITYPSSSNHTSLTITQS